MRYSEGEGLADDLALSVKNLGRSYAMYKRPVDRLVNAFVPSICQPKRISALRDVSFEVKRGETFGIVGRNGSGKSTLLQIICGIMPPSAGDVTVRGRIAALLELGSGFNPEFTGRENVFLNGAILGFSRKEMEARYDSIVEFANIGSYIDYPVRTYSSGMQARLGFAVAINVDPDILVVDEALAVGDDAFKRRCYARIEEIRDNGATILFVSHATGTVSDLCQRGILLHNGEMLAYDAAFKVVDAYQKLVFAPEGKRELVADALREGRDPDEALVNAGEDIVAADKQTFDENLKSLTYMSFVENGARLSNIRIENENGEETNILQQYETYFVCFDVKFTEDNVDIYYDFHMRTINGIELGGVRISHKWYVKQGNGVNAGEKFRVRVPFQALLNAGTYFCNVEVSRKRLKDLEILHKISDAYAYRIKPKWKNAGALGKVSLIADAPAQIVSHDEATAESAPVLGRRQA